MLKIRPKHILLVLFILLIQFSVVSQSKTDLFLTPSDTLNKPRRNVVVITEASLGVTTLVGLNQLWYSD